MVSKELIEELKTILEEECGVSLPVNEVEKLANTLVSCFSLLDDAERSRLQIVA